MSSLVGYHLSSSIYSLPSIYVHDFFRTDSFSNYYTFSLCRLRCCEIEFFGFLNVEIKRMNES
jgi:hypothetical protein